MRKQRIATIILIFLLIISLSTVVSADAVNVYPQWQTIDGVSTIRCTWYAWQQVYDNTGVALPNFGNAVNWYTSAQTAGYAVGSEARAGAIAVWSGGTYGHVSYVVGVNGSKMTVNEAGMLNTSGGAYNGTGICNGNVVNSIVGQQKGSGSNKILLGFIYIDQQSSNCRVEHGFTGYSDTITENNAIVYGTVYKPIGGVPQYFGIRLRPSYATYDNGGWTYMHVPSQNYTGNTTVMIYYNVQDEMGVTLTHATSYTYQLLAKIDGVEYWSEEKSFTTPGSHSYGAYSKLDNATHMRSCITCGKTETANHSWNSGTITKEPTCNTTGIKTYTCNGCGATKTEDIATSNNHSYGKWVNFDFLTHKHTCTICQDVVMADHNWGNGTVTKQPTCKDYGTKVYTCSGCGTTKTESISKLTTHSWNNGTVTKQPTCKDYGTKVYSCTVCGNTKTENVAKLTTHTYDNACDNSCNVCAKTRNTTHDYKISWSKDGTNHWHECSVCKNKKDSAAHTPGAEATETLAQTCTTCGYVIKAALNHQHSYSSTYSIDANEHWYKCIGCEETTGHAGHIFENDCDTDCSVCGYCREITHAYSENWEKNDTQHWRKCAYCGSKINEEPHTPSAATGTSAQICAICSYVISPAQENTEATENQTTTPENLGTKPTEGSTSPSETTNNEATENTTAPPENHNGEYIEETNDEKNYTPVSDITIWIIIAIGIALGIAIAIITIWNKTRKSR